MSNEPRYTLGVMTGDGIGPEIVPAAVRVGDAALATAGAAAIRWRELPLGLAAIDSHGEPVPASTLDALAETDGWVLGPHDSASYPEPFGSQLNPSGTIRKHFDLFANIRPAKAIAGQASLAPGIDLVIYRENTEGFYADRSTYRGSGEFMPTPDVAIARGIITRAGCERIARAAFTAAARRRRRLTIVHKANVLRLTTGMFRDICLEVGRDFPEVSVDQYHIDAFTVHLLRHAGDLDVVVTENMFGDILSDLAGEVAGSLGVAPSLNVSAERAMAQASHGSAPDIAGQDRANPIAMVLSVAMLVDWLAGRHRDPALASAARLIEQGVDDTVAAGISTPDLGGSATCSGFADEVVARISGRRSG